jgi:hypothetical protein
LEELTVDKKEILHLQTYLREKFGNNAIHILEQSLQNNSVEVNIGEEFIGILYRDNEEGEVSYAFQMAILDIDLRGSDA